MDFSELFKCSGPCEFSPNGKLIANAAGYRLLIRDVASLEVIQLYTCIDSITQLEWSSDSNFVLCAMSKRGAVQVWSVEDENWHCKIEEGPAGISHARFSPDGRHVLTVSEHLLRITIWSLVNKSVSYIKYPKYSTKGLDFTPDGRYMALAERKDCKDYVSIFTTETWELVKHFQVDTQDLADLKWSPNSRVLAVWDTCLQYKVILYAPDGRKLESYSAYEHALGIKTVAWSPSSQLLAVGSYADQMARLLNSTTWKVLGEYSHSPVIEKSKAIVFEEVEYAADDIGSTTRTRYVVKDLPVTVPSVKVQPEKPNPKLGVGLMGWSADSRYLLTRNDNMPNTLWIWDTAKLSLSVVLIHLAPIKHAQWDPIHPRLALCTDTERIYMWSHEGSSCVDVPAFDFKVHSLKWSPDGQSLVLQDKGKGDQGKFCVCFPQWQNQ